MKAYIAAAFLSIISPFMYTVINNYMSDRKEESINEKIHRVELLLKNSLGKTYDIYRQPDIETTEFYASTTWKEENGKDIFLLVPGAHSSFGIWSRRVTVRDGVNVGTMLSYVEMSHKLGFDTIIVQPTERRSSYLDLILETIISETNKTIHIAVHSYGGLCVMHSLPENGAFRERVSTINLLDSVHTDEPHQLREYLEDNVVNWAASDLPLGEPLLQEDIDIQPNFMRWLSAGHEIHEYTPYSALNSIFIQLQDRK